MADRLTLRPSLAVSFAFTLACLAQLAACGADDKNDGAMPALPVNVTLVKRQDVPLFVELVGTTMGAQDVPIRARVEGFLESMDFAEGGFVKEGDLLYTIDAQPFQARLIEAQSHLATAKTNHVKTQSDLARIKPLAEIDAVSQQDLDGAVAQEAASRSSVRAAEAAVSLAQIELSYTRLIAPIDGLIGLSKAKPGEFVGRDPNPVVLNVLSDIDPIRVRFSVAEREYLQFARNYLQGKRALDITTQRRRDLVLLLADGTEHTERGSVIASAQAINPETGTYSIEASFPNPNRLILPGQFARVRAPQTVLTNAVVVPRRAVNEIQGIHQVFVVGVGNVIEVREVIAGPVFGNSIVIKSGLDGGETIVVEGLQKVRNGVPVDPRMVGPANDVNPAQQM